MNYKIKISPLYHPGKIKERNFVKSPGGYSLFINKVFRMKRLNFSRLSRSINGDDIYKSVRQKTVYGMTEQFVYPITKHKFKIMDI